MPLPGVLESTGHLQAERSQVALRRGIGLDAQDANVRCRGLDSTSEVTRTSSEVQDPVASPQKPDVDEVARQFGVSGPIFGVLVVWVGVDLNAGPGTRIGNEQMTASHVRTLDDHVIAGREGNRR